MNEKEFERFKTYVVFGHPDGCWESYKKLDCRGYARFWWRGQWRQGHRIAYMYVDDDFTLRDTELEIPEDRPQLDHQCNNRQCWRPSHLQPVTGKRNHELRAQRYFERKRKALEEEAI